MIHISSFVTYKLPLKKVSKNLSHPLPSLTAYHSLLRIFTNWTIERIIRDDERKFRLTLPSPPPRNRIFGRLETEKKFTRVYVCIRVYSWSADNVSSGIPIHVQYGADSSRRIPVRPISLLPVYLVHHHFADGEPREGRLDDEEREDGRRNASGGERWRSGAYSRAAITASTRR